MLPRIRRQSASALAEREKSGKRRSRDKVTGKIDAIAIRRQRVSRQNRRQRQRFANSTRLVEGAMASGYAPIEADDVSELLIQSHISV